MLDIWDQLAEWAFHSKFIDWYVHLHTYELHVSPNGTYVHFHVLTKICIGAAGGRILGEIFKSWTGDSGVFIDPGRFAIFWRVHRNIYKTPHILIFIIATKIGTYALIGSAAMLGR